MPFVKGNQLGKKNKGKLGIRKRACNEVSEQLISLSPRYNELLEGQMNGHDISKPEKEGMDRFEKMYEFARPKLARSEITGKDGGDINLNINDEQAQRLSKRAEKFNNLTNKI